MNPSEEPGGHVRRLSAIDAMAVVIGIVIGSGIFAFPSFVAANTPNTATMLGLWIIGGLVGLIGAFCYAELSCTYPNTGGDYHFLRRAYGPDVGFLFVWGRMTVIQTGALAAAAFIAGDYFSTIFPLGDHSSAIYAGLIIVLLSAVNLAGLQTAKWTQNLLVAAMTIGLLTIAAAGFWLGITDGPPPPPAVAEGSASTPLIGLAMIFVLFTYGGWNEAAYLSSEIKDPGKNIPKALILGLGIILAIYLLVNLAFLAGLGQHGMAAASTTVAADLLGRAWGEPGAKFISLLVLITVLSTINATILTGARSNYALGRDYPRVFGFLGKWNNETSVPVAALIFQGIVALGLVALAALVFKEGGLEAMIAYTAPVFWFFFFLAGLSVIVLRRRDPRRERPFRVPFYPITPFLFCGVCLYMLYSAIAYAGTGSLVGVAVLFAGVPFLIATRSGNNPTSTSGPKNQTPNL